MKGFLSLCGMQTSIIEPKAEMSTGMHTHKLEERTLQILIRDETPISTKGGAISLGPAASAANEKVPCSRISRAARSQRLNGS